jgi:hypothetical protein
MKLVEADFGLSAVDHLLAAGQGQLAQFGGDFVAVLE